MTALLNPDMTHLKDSEGPRCFHLSERDGLAQIKGGRLVGFLIGISDVAHDIDAVLCAEIAAWAQVYAAWETRFASTLCYRPEDCRDFPVEEHAAQGMTLAQRLCAQLPDDHYVFHAPLHRKAFVPAQWIDDMAAGAHSHLPLTCWGDGTPIARDDPDGDQPWGASPEGRWVRVMPDTSSCGLWDVAGCGRDPAELPLYDAVLQRLAAWQDRYNDYEAYTILPTPPRQDAQTLRWLSAEGQAIKAALPADWTVVYHDIGSDRAFRHLYEYAVDAPSTLPASPTT